jgi:site-specific recombinase XerD
MVGRTAEILRREKMEMTLLTLIDLFVATKQTEGRSPSTIRWYKKRLLKFVAWLGGEAARIKDLTVHKARSFVASLQARDVKWPNHPTKPAEKGGLSPHTIHGYVRAIKAFGAWLEEEEFTSRHPFQKLKRPKLPQTMIQILSDDEIKGILDCINPNCFLGARLNTVVLLLLDTGIRASELTGLTMENTDIANGTIKVVGKGNKERIVPLGATTKKALLRYMVTWRPEPMFDDVDQVILSVDGTPLTYGALGHIVKRVGLKAGVPRLHAHLFRHTFAVRYLMNGGDVMTLRLILGHATLDVTQMYMHLAESHIKIQHHKFSPVDRLRIR